MVDLITKRLQGSYGCVISLFASLAVGAGADAFTALKWLGIWLFLALVILTMKHRISVPHPWLGGLVIGWPIASVLWVQDPPAYLAGLPGWIVLSVAWCCGCPTGPFKRGVRTGLWWAAQATALYAIIQVLGWDLVTWDLPGQAVSFWGNPQDTGAFLILAWCLGKRPKQAPVGWVGDGLILLGCVATNAKLVVLALALYALLRTTYRRRYLVLGVAAFGLAAGWLVRDLAPLRPYMLDGTAYAQAFAEQPWLIADRDPAFRGKPLSVMVRVELAQTAAQMVWQRPWRGAGLGQFGAVYPQHVSPSFVMDHDVRPHSAHQVMLHGAAEFGLVWLVLACIWLAFWFRRLPKVYRSAVLLQLVLAMGSSSYHQVAILFWLVWLRPGHRVKRQIRWLEGLAMFCALGAFSLRWWPLETAVGRWMKPASYARLAWQNDHRETATQAFGEAWRRDRWGPERIYNLGLLALQLAEHPGTPEAEAGLRAMLWLECEVPRHRLAKERLNELRKSQSWTRREAELLNPSGSRDQQFARLQLAFERVLERHPE